MTRPGGEIITARTHAAATAMLEDTLAWLRGITLGRAVGQGVSKQRPITPGTTRRRAKTQAAWSRGRPGWESQP